jgi:hypothetical protein
MFTGDQIGSLSRLLGGALYGRLMGIPSLISSVVNAVVGIATGKDIGEHVFAFISGSLRDSSSGAEVQTVRAPATDGHSDAVVSGAEQTYAFDANGYVPGRGADARVIRRRRAPLRASAREGGLQAVAEKPLESARDVKANKPAKQIVFAPDLMPLQSWPGKAALEILDLYERAPRPAAEPPDYLSAARRE